MSSSARLGSYGPAPEPPRSIYAYAENYHPSLHERRLYRNRATGDQVRERPPRVRLPANGDADRRRRRDERDHEVPPRDEQRRVDVEVEEILVNGAARHQPHQRDSSSSSSSRRRANGTSARSASASRHQQQRHRRSSDRSSESLDRKTSNGHGRSASRSQPWSDDDDDDDDDCQPNGHRHDRNDADDDDDHNGKYHLNNNSTNNNHNKNNNNNNNYSSSDNYNNNRYDAERYGSLKKKNEKNAGLNFRAIIEKFRAKPTERSHHRARKQVDEDDRREARSPKKKSSHARGKSNGVHERKQSTSPECDDEEHRRDRRNGSKRRSYAFEASPEDFDVRIEKYERARRGNNSDAELQRRGSFTDRGSSDGSQKLPPPRRAGNVVRKSSLKGSQARVRSKPPKPKVSERHSRPLTPPAAPLSDEQQQFERVLANFYEESREPAATSGSKKSHFSMKEWYETNRQFAAKYLKEHSKVKELSTGSDVSARDEFVFGSAKECQTFHEIENLQKRLRERNSLREDSEEEEEQGQEQEQEQESQKRSNGSQPGHPRRASAEDVRDAAESPRRERSFVMPGRKAWDYRDGV